MAIPKKYQSPEEFREWVETICDEEDVDATPRQLIYTAKKIFSISRNVELPEAEKAFYKNNYLNLLLDYGYRAKGEWEEGGNIAKVNFVVAITMEEKLPIAHYRLGHIHFKREEFGKAVSHFYSAINLQNNPYDSKYSLENYQIANARKILSYCTLKIFEQNKSSALENSMYPELDNLIEAYLAEENNYHEEKPIVLWKFKDGIIDKTQISYSDYCEIKDQVDTKRALMYIDTYTNTPCAGYGGEEITLSPVILRLLLDIMRGEFQDELIPQGNSFNQSVRRLKLRLMDLNLVPPVFDLINLSNEKPNISSDLTIYIFKHIEE